MKYKNEISLADLTEKSLNVYVRLDKDFQYRLLSAETLKISIEGLSKALSIEVSRIYAWKIGNVSLPLYFGRLIIEKYSKLFSWMDFCKNIKEIKHGQRSKQFYTDSEIFPIKKDPYYWSIIFALFCDGSSEWWSSQNKSLSISPSYTSYRDEITENFIDIVQTVFGKWFAGIYDGSINIPPLVDFIFKNEHSINSFNTKSEKIDQFKLSEEFRNEISNLNKLNKIAILIRFLVDEGDKTERTLNVKCPNLTITTTSMGLLDILKLILTDLGIKYHVIIRDRKNPKWKTPYVVQILRGEKRKNYRKLKIYIDSVIERYPLCKLTDTQYKCLQDILNYKYNKPRYDFSQSKITEFLITDFIKAKKRVSLDEIRGLLKRNKLDFNVTSILCIIKRMPTKRENKLILYTSALESYIPYRKEQITDATIYFKTLKLYKNGKTITEIAKMLNKPWTTIRDWVYSRTKPTVLHGPWKDLCIEKGLIKLAD